MNPFIDEIVSKTASFEYSDSLNARWSSAEGNAIEHERQVNRSWSTMLSSRSTWVVDAMIEMVEVDEKTVGVDCLKSAEIR